MKFDANKIRKLLNLIQENQENSLDAVSKGLTVTTDEGLKYTVEEKLPDGIVVSYSDLVGNYKREKLSFEKFKSMFQKSKKDKKKSKKEKVVTDD